MNAQGTQLAISKTSRTNLSSLDPLTKADEERRLEKLQEQLDLLDDILSDRDEWIERYVGTLPVAQYDSGSSDAERFLEWLRQHRPLTIAENDAVCCQSAHFAVESMVRLNPGRHRRFQGLWSTAPSLPRELPRHAKAWFVVNPIHVWTTLSSTEMVSDVKALPAQVVFFPVQSDVRSAVVTRLGQKFVCHLSETGPCRWSELLNICYPEPEIEVMGLCRELIAVGLVSLG